MDHYDRKRSKVRKKGSERIILIRKDHSDQKGSDQKGKMIGKDQNDRKRSK